MIAEPKVRNIDHDKFVTIVHLNVRNVMTKKEDLKCDFDIQKAAVVCFTESHLGKNDKITPNKIGLRDNMEIFHCDWDSNGGGVIICVHSWYNPKVLQADQCGLELVGVGNSCSRSSFHLLSFTDPQHTVVRHLCTK